jgi:SOS-response transcriptional repressor LexA
MNNQDGVSVHSGFPNPAIDQPISKQSLGLDFNQVLIKNPSSTYLFRITGHTWSDQGIFDNDIAVVDRSVPRRPKDLVIIWQNDDFRLCRQRELLHSGQGELAWGVVSAVIHQF